MRPLRLLAASAGVFFTVIVAVHADLCATVLNSCNGHGLCDATTLLCDCYPGWGAATDVATFRAPDCSLRTQSCMMFEFARERGPSPATIAPRGPNGTLCDDALLSQGHAPLGLRGWMCRHPQQQHMQYKNAQQGACVTEPWAPAGVLSGLRATLASDVRAALSLIPCARRLLPHNCILVDSSCSILPQQLQRERKVCEYLANGF